MKVLLATDGSPDARCAEQLAASIRWPAGTLLTLLHVDAPLPGDSELPSAALIALHDEIRAEIKLHLDPLGQEIANAHPRAKIERLTLPGRPGTVIVEHARARSDDLVIVGSRGHGAIASAILGSVAAEVVDHAPCPVLVARTRSISSVVVADDGSDSARQAQEVIATWPLLRGARIRVVSVADMSPLTTGFASGMTAGVDNGYAEMIAELRHLHEGYAREAAQRLSGPGRNVTHEARHGFVAQEIVAAAADTRADLIVVGSRGRTGLARIFLGSVARSVLFQAPVSVLIVRQKVELPQA